MGKVFDQIQRNLREQVEANTRPRVPLTHYYIDDGGKVMSHTYFKDVFHTCEHKDCPSYESC